MLVKYSVSRCIDGQCNQQKYSRWLHRKAMAHVRRDRRREVTCTVERYKGEIHAAVCASEGRDYYTGEQLDWTLLSTWDNNAAKSGRVQYKKSLALLPTVDHTFDEAGQPKFVICSWYVNDVKSDLTLAEFYRLCERILKHRGDCASPRGQ